MNGVRSFGRAKRLLNQALAAATSDRVRLAVLDEHAACFLDVQEPQAGLADLDSSAGSLQEKFPAHLEELKDKLRQADASLQAKVQAERQVRLAGLVADMENRLAAAKQRGDAGGTAELASQLAKAKARAGLTADDPGQPTTPTPQAAPADQTTPAGQ